MTSSLRRRSPLPPAGSRVAPETRIAILAQGGSNQNLSELLFASSSLLLRQVLITAVAELWVDAMDDATSQRLLIELLRFMGNLMYLLQGGASAVAGKAQVAMKAMKAKKAQAAMKAMKAKRGRPRLDPAMYAASDRKRLLRNQRARQRYADRKA